MAHRQERLARLGLWFAFLGPPVAWLAALTLSYVFEDFTCSLLANEREPVLAGALPVAILLVNVVLALVVIAAGVVGLRLRRRRALPGDPASVTRFLGVVGATLSALFLFGIVLLAVNPLAFTICG